MGPRTEKRPASRHTCPSSLSTYGEGDAQGYAQGNAQGRQEGEGHEGHEAPRHEEEEGRGSGGGADEGDAEEVSLSWALTSNGTRLCREAPISSTATCGA